MEPNDDSKPRGDVPAAGSSPQEEKPSVAFPIVGIGASAGGLEALEALTRRLSRDGMAFIVIQHLAPSHESVLTDILSRCTQLKVVTIHDREQVEVNTIYVTPPGAELSLQQGELRVLQPSGKVPRHSIDALFRSMAAELGPFAIGVVLSGAGSDGTLGLRAIKERGGITFAQDPATASQSSMPQSALDAGCADFTLSPEEIGDELMRLSAHPYVARKRPPRLFATETLAKLFEQLLRRFGVDFSSYKPSTLERRIQRRMALQKLEKIEDYLKLLETSAQELNLLYSDLLIGVTGFFRDREPFEILKTTVFPRLLERRSAHLPLRIWVPGCASGEEAYSIGICLLEYLEGQRADCKIQIFGTDIDDQALMRARQGIYPPSIELDLSPERLQRFFSRLERGYQVSQQLRDMVLFAHHSLGKDPPFSRLDVVSCRNVLIYMQPHMQQRVLRSFHYGLNPDAFLLLGTSESIGDAADLFSLVDRKLKIYVKKNIPSGAVFDFTFGMRGEQTTAPAAERLPAVSAQQLADRKVLEKFGPAGLLLDEKMEVIQFRGQTGPYLGPSPGVATLNALKLIRTELLLELRSAIQRVSLEGIPVTSPPISLWGEHGVRQVLLEVMPIQEPETQRKCLLVLFSEASPPTPEQAARLKEEREHAPPRLHEVERELLITKEYLQTTIQETEAFNEELQSANEELQSANEELQSTNEELETSKEELQSTNEELATVNEELQNRMAQLGRSNDDLQNILDSTSAPMILVGMDQRIRSFSRAAAKLLNLIAGDVGRPIGYVGGSIPDLSRIEEVVSDAVNTLQTKGKRVRCSDAHSYTMLVQPYRTAEHSTLGAIIEFVRLPPGRMIGDPTEIDELVGKVLSTLPHVLMLLDEQLRVVWVNKAFFEKFQVGAEILGRSLEEIWPGRDAEPQLWAALEETITGDKPFEAVVIRHPFGIRSGRPMRFSARSLPAEGARPALRLVVMEDVD
jgi:two-component system CheB/CheR fusion protein